MAHPKYRYRRSANVHYAGRAPTENEKGKSHQIRLSGDPEFQRRLRQARLLLRRLDLGEGHLNDVGALSFHVASPDELIKLHHSGRFSIASTHAKAPAPRSLVIADTAVTRLAELRSEMIAQDENGINLRAIVHYAICVLTEKDDKFVMNRLNRDLN